VRPWPSARAERIEAIGQASKAKLFGFIWFYLDLLGFAWFCLVLLGFGWICLVLFVRIRAFQWVAGKKIKILSPLALRLDRPQQADLMRPVLNRIARYSDFCKLNRIGAEFPSVACERHEDARKRDGRADGREAREGGRRIAADDRQTA
jgi:hypothetical protein